MEAADSLWEAAVSIERDGDQVCAESTLRMECKTPECGAEALTTYTLDLPFTVVTGPDLHVATARVTQRHEWRAGSLKDEPDPASHPLSTKLEGVAGRPVAVGISGFSVALDAAHHTRGLDLAVHPGPIREDGTVPVDAELFYVQWGPVEIAPLTVAQFANEGSAELSADLVLVQPAEGQVTSLRTEGTLYWPGKGADASVTDATHASPVGVGSQAAP